MVQSELLLKTVVYGNIMGDHNSTANSTSTKMAGLYTTIRYTSIMPE